MNKFLELIKKLKVKSEYLMGVIKKPSEFHGIFVVGSGRDAWYAGSYDFVKSNSYIKKEIIEFTSSLNKQTTVLRDWEWHHVVETQHMNQIINFNFHQEEWFNMPTILISKREHTFLSQNFNNNAFRELSTVTKGRKISRQIEPQKRRDTIGKLKMMYENAYANYPTLKKIAMNVFSHHLIFLPK